MQTVPTESTPAPVSGAPDAVAQQRRALAIAQLKRKKQFLYDVVVYLVINMLLVAIWATTGAGYFWPIWVILGWGAIVVIHGYVVYRGNILTEAQIEREMQQLPSDAAGLPDDWRTQRAERRAERRESRDM